MRFFFRTFRKKRKALSHKGPAGRGGGPARVVKGKVGATRKGKGKKVMKKGDREGCFSSHRGQKKGGGTAGQGSGVMSETWPEEARA